MPEVFADRLLEAIRAKGAPICVGIDPVSSRRSLEMAESFRGVFATAGVHPHSASEFDRPAGSAIEELLADPLVVGVGETGLDYYRRLSPPDDQQRAFRTHIALSRETCKPLVVHVRDAWDDALRILAQEGAERVVLHCFSGDEQVVREAAGRGYFLSFAGNLTYPGAGPLKAAATAFGTSGWKTVGMMKLALSSSSLTTCAMAYAAFSSISVVIAEARASSSPRRTWWKPQLLWPRFEV